MKPPNQFSCSPVVVLRTGEREYGADLVSESVNLAFNLCTFSFRVRGVCLCPLLSLVTGLMYFIHQLIDLSICYHSIVRTLATTPLQNRNSKGLTSNSHNFCLRTRNRIIFFKFGELKFASNHDRVKLVGPKLES